MKPSKMQKSQTLTLETSKTLKREEESLYLFTRQRRGKKVHAVSIPPLESFFFGGFRWMVVRIHDLEHPQKQNPRYLPLRIGTVTEISSKITGG